MNRIIISPNCVFGALKTILDNWLYNNVSLKIPIDKNLYFASRKYVTAHSASWEQDAFLLAGYRKSLPLAEAL